MNDPIFWRLVWKEYRSQRAFWLAVFVMAILVQFIVGWLFFNGTAVDAPKALRNALATAYLFPALFALGSGAMSFALEREEGTDRLLRQLAAGARQLMVGKVFVASVGAVLMMVLLAGVAWFVTAGPLKVAISHVHVPPLTVVFGACLAVLFVFGFLFWTVFFSLCVAHVLTALCFGAFMTLLCLIVIINLPWAPPTYWEACRNWRWFLTVVGHGGGVLVILAVVDYWLARAWVAREDERLEFADWQHEQTSRVEHLQWAQWEIVRVSPWRRRVQRLMWLEWRAGWKGIALFTGTWLGVMNSGLLRSLWSADQTAVAPEINYVYFVGVPVLAVCLMSALSAFQRSHRENDPGMLGERGVSPGLLWLSKQLVWLPAALLFSTALVVFSPFALAKWLGPSGSAAQYGLAVAHVLHTLAFLPAHLTFAQPEQVWLSAALWSGALHFAVFVTLLYAGMQLVSILIPRAVTAAAVSLFAAFVLCSWYGYNTSLPRLICVIPVIAILLVASLVRLTDWLDGRQSRQAWWRLAAAVVLPSVLVLGATALYRVYRIPAVSTEFLDADVPKPPTAEECQTAREYCELIRTLRFGTPEEPLPTIESRRLSYRWKAPSEPVRRWVESRESSIQKIVECSARPSCAILDPTTADSVALSLRRPTRLSIERDVAVSIPPLREWFDLVHALVRSAHILEGEGRLDAAMDRYTAALRVSRHIAQKGGVEQYVAGRAFAEYVYYRISGWAAHREQTLERLERAINAIRHEADRFPSPAAALNVQHDALVRTLRKGRPDEAPSFWPAYAPWVRILPWERAALVRAVRFTHEVDYWRLKSLERGLRSPYFAFEAWLAAMLRTSQRRPDRCCLRYSLVVAQFPPGDRRVVTDVFGRWPLYPEFQDLAASTMSHETRLRALLITLALAAYQLDHGHLPDALEPLVPKYLAQLPCDPWTGRPFGYKPSGVPGSVSIALLPNRLKALPAHQPFLWSGGAFNAHLTLAPESDEQERKGRRYLLVDATGEPVKETDWRRFWVWRLQSVWPPLRFSEQMRGIGFDFWGGMLFPIPGESDTGKPESERVEKSRS